MIESLEAAMNALEVVKTLVVPASITRVWRAISDPKELVRWFPDEKADVAVAPGEEGAWVWHGHGAYSVRIDVVEPPTRLVWSWARDPDRPLADTVVTTVEFRLEKNEDDTTTLHLRESGFVREQDRGGNDTGWDKELGELVSYLESGS
jgi:uncharacterized protein YndB with AHSA1/START domain